MIDYRVSTATELQMYNHLNKCSDNFIPPLSETVEIGEYARKLHANSVTFEAWNTDKLIGLVAVYFNDAASLSAFISNVSVDKDYMGSGIASHLVQMCVDHAAENDFDQIKLEVNAANEPAIKMYEKFEFEEYDTMNESLIMRRKIKSIV